MNLRTLTLLVITLVIGVGIGYTFASAKKHSHNIALFQQRSHAAGERFTNPLLECELGEEYIAEGSIRPFRDVIEKEIQSFIRDNKASHVSYYFRDLNNGAWFGFNEKEFFSPASLLKVPLAIHVLAESERDPSILSEQILFDGEAADAQQFIPAGDPLEKGTAYTVEQLLEHMIVNSDNDAALLLLSHFDPAGENGVFQHLGIALGGKEGDAQISVRDYAGFFRTLYNASFLSQRNSEQLLSLLSRAHFNAGIQEGIPNVTKLAHKFGERSDGETKQLHDCGIVYDDTSPYLLCIMTRGESFLTLSHVISSLSKITFEEVEKQKQHYE